MKTLDLNIIEVKGKDTQKLMDYVKSINFDYEKMIPIPKFIGYEEWNLSDKIFSYRDFLKNQYPENEVVIDMILRECNYNKETLSYRQNVTNLIKNQQKIGFSSAYIFRIFHWSVIEKAKNIKFEETQFEFYSEYIPTGIIIFLTKKFNVEILHYVADGYESVYHVKKGKSKRINNLKSYEWQ